MQITSFASTKERDTMRSHHHICSILLLAASLTSASCIDPDEDSEGPCGIAGCPSPGLGVESSLNLPATQLGAMRAEPLALKSVGREDLHISEIVLEGDGAFTIELPTLPMTLEPGEEAALTIRYAPTEGSRHNAKLMIQSDTPGDLPRTVALTGSVAP
jgi:hypothetical protein